ncbi:ATP-binding protein [Oryzobacter telluris]|uniref:ATP-binding protein n=1 Tax=Oryzobacter telluris TaxID=3149179 RepID=UPI00370D8CBD
MAGNYRVDTLAVPETLNLLHDLLDRVRTDHPDVERTDLMLFETAVIEIANNVVEHGRPPGTVHYSFTLDVEPDKLRGLLSEGGEALPELRFVMPGHDSEEGRGLALAKMALDDLEYERVGDHNEWRMTRVRR